MRSTDSFLSATLVCSYNLKAYNRRNTAFTASNFDFDDQQGLSNPKFSRALSCLFLKLKLSRKISKALPNSVLKTNKNNK